MSLISRAVLFPGAALLLLAHPAAAIEPEAAAAALAAALAKGSDSKATYESAAADGGNIVIKGLTISRGADEPTITFAETLIEAPAESENGVFESPRMTFTDGTIAGTSTGSIAVGTLTGVTVLDPDDDEGRRPRRKHPLRDGGNDRHHGRPRGPAGISRRSRESSWNRATSSTTSRRTARASSRASCFRRSSSRGNAIHAGGARLREAGRSTSPGTARATWPAEP